MFKVVAAALLAVAAWARARQAARRTLREPDAPDADEPLPPPGPPLEISDDPRDNPPLTITPQELADALRKRFADLLSGQELRMRSVEPDGDAVRVLLDGHVGDRGGLYGAIVTIPRSTEDPRWAEWQGFGRDEWIEHACFWLVVEAYDTRHYIGARDGITWLDLD